MKKRRFADSRAGLALRLKSSTFPIAWNLFFLPFWQTKSKRLDLLEQDKTKSELTMAATA